MWFYEDNILKANLWVIINYVLSLVSSYNDNWCHSSPSFKIRLSWTPRVSFILCIMSKNNIILQPWENLCKWLWCRQTMKDFIVMESCVCLEWLCRRKMTLSKNHREENDEGYVGQSKDVLAYLLGHLHTSLMKMFAKGYQVPEKTRQTFSPFSGNSFFFRGTQE